ITPQQLATEVGEAFPGRYRDLTAHHIGQNTGSSWQQAGYLTGRVRKFRAHPTLNALVYALYLGHVEGYDGPSLFGTLWARLLDADERWLRDTAAEAG